MQLVVKDGVCQILGNMIDIYRKMLLGILVVVLNIRDVAQALHITKLVVPEIKATGEGMWLECEWATDGDRIYALKWYLGLDEFYRWTPASEPRMKTFDIIRDPIHVDLNISNKGKVWVHRLTLEAAGVYRCEVSAEAPSFHTESHTSSLRVVDLPDTKPQITGIQPLYQLHEEVHLNCTSPLSNPRANLTFYVNDEQADISWLFPYKSIEDYPTGLETAVLGLRFLLHPRLLDRGRVSIKCTADLAGIYWDRSETEIMVDVPYHASVMEGRASSACGLLTTVMNMISTTAASVACLML